MYRKSKGLTALELLISLSLAIVLMMVGIPGLREYGFNQQIKSATARLVSDLNLTRNEAIIRNMRAVACPADAGSTCSAHSEWHRGWLIFGDSNGDRQRQPGEPLIRRADPLDSLTAISPSSRQQIQFFPGGTAPGTNMSIVICDHRGFEKGRKIVISNSGRIRQANLVDSDTSRCPGQ